MNEGKNAEIILIDHWHPVRKLKNSVVVKGSEQGAGMLPSGWERLPLRKCARFLSGNTPSKEHSDYWNGDFPWITAKDMKVLCLTRAGLGLTETGKNAAAIAPPLSVLVLTRGMTLLKDLPVALAMREIGFNQDIKALVAKPDLDPWFLAFQLLENKSEILNLVDTSGHGTGRLDTELLKAYEIPVPPLAEQRRIVEVLTTATEEIDVLAKQLAVLKKQKRALMQQLLTGKRRVRLVETEAGPTP